MRKSVSDFGHSSENYNTLGQFRAICSSRLNDGYIRADNKRNADYVHEGSFTSTIMSDNKKNIPTPKQSTIEHHKVESKDVFPPEAGEHFKHTFTLKNMKDALTFGVGFGYGGNRDFEKAWKEFCRLLGIKDSQP